MADRMRLYTSPSAFPNPRRVRLLMHEKGIADRVEEVVLDMAPGGEQRGWRHLKRSPWGETATLELPDGGCLAESTAIGRDLDANSRNRKVMGDVTLCTAVAFSKFRPNETPPDEHFEQVDRFWRNWKTRNGFRLGYADGGGLPELAS